MCVMSVASSDYHESVNVREICWFNYNINGFLISNIICMNNDKSKTLCKFLLKYGEFSMKFVAKSFHLSLVNHFKQSYVNFNGYFFNITSIEAQLKTFVSRKIVLFINKTLIRYCCLVWHSCLITTMIK